MGTGFFRKRASQAKAKHNARNWRLVWARPHLEALDSRVLPSVNATLNGQGILKIVADTHQGTHQVEIIQSQDQITVEDGGTEINSFDITQVQQIDFKYREGQQQHAHINLDIPVNQAQMTLTGFSINEADLNIGNDALTAKVAAALPDGTGVQLAGPVNTDGTFDLAGFAAAIDVGSVPLILPRFDLTDQGMTVEGHALPGLPYVGGADFTGSLTPDGTYALTAPLQDFTVSGYTLTNASAALSNDGLVLTATTNVPIVGNVNITGDLTVDGHYSLTASVPTVNVLGFTLNNVSVTLDDAHDLTFGATATLPLVGAVTFTGSATPDGHYSLTATAGNFTVVGFTFSNVTATLDNSGLTVAADATVATDNWSAVVHFSGNVMPNGQFRLQGTATNVNFDGFISGAGSFTLTNSGLSFMGDITVGLDQGTVQVHFAGTLNANRQFLLVGTATTTNFDGFISGNAAFTLTNSGMTAVGDITVGLDQGTVQVHFAGTVNVNHQFLLVGTATTTNFDGFISGNAVFTLSNAGMTVAGDLTVGLDTVTVDVHFMGTVNVNRQYRLTGTVMAGSTPQFDGYLSANAAFTLTNSGMTVAGTLDITLSGVTAHVQYMGTVDTNRQYVLTGTLTAGSMIGFNGFLSADAAFSFRNSGATITNGHLSYVMGSLTVTGTFTATLNPNGSYVVNGTVQTNPLLNGFLVASATFRIDNANGLTFTGQVDLNRYLPGFPLITFSGWVHTDHHYQITGQGPRFTILNFVTSSSQFTLSDSGLSVSASVNVFVAQVTLRGTIQSNGQFSLTGSASVGFAGFGGSGSFTLTNSGLMFSGTVNVVVATISVAGSISSTGTYSFMVNARMSFAGFGASGSLTLNNSGVMVSATLDLGVMGARMSFSGAVLSNGTYRFTATAGIHFGPVSASLSLTLANTGFSAHLHAGVDVSANVGTDFWSVHVGFGGSLDVNFAIGTNGNYSASGNLTMTAYAGVTLSVSIGFSLTNHQFTVRTGSIGFSVFGVHFMPFSDATFNY